MSHIVLFLTINLREKQQNEIKTNINIEKKKQ
jgi:hypothetical protein